MGQPSREPVQSLNADCGIESQQDGVHVEWGMRSAESC